MLARAGFALALWLLGAGVACAQYASRDPENPTCPIRIYAYANPMEITLDQSNGQRALVLNGFVGAGTADRIAAALRNNAPIDVILLHSQGGDAREGNRITTIIRNSGVPVHIPDDWWCVSACNFIFFGGVIRTIAPRGVFGVHMATAVNNETFWNNNRGRDAYDVIAEQEQEMALLTAEDIDLVIRMGISRDLLTEVMYAQKAHETQGDASTVRCLTRYEMRRYNVVNVD